MARCNGDGPLDALPHGSHEPTPPPPRRIWPPELEAAEVLPPDAPPTPTQAEPPLPWPTNDDDAPPVAARIRRPTVGGASGSAALRADAEPEPVYGPLPWDLPSERELERAQTDEPPSELATERGADSELVGVIPLHGQPAQEPESPARDLPAQRPILSPLRLVAVTHQETIRLPDEEPPQAADEPAVEAEASVEETPQAAADSQAPLLKPDASGDLSQLLAEAEQVVTAQEEDSPAQADQPAPSDALPTLSPPPAVADLISDRIQPREAAPVEPEASAIVRRIQFDPPAALRGALEALSQRLLAAGRPSPGRVVFSAAEPGAGVTELVASLAAHVARARPDLRIALVDLNLRQPRLAELFDVATSPGVAEILAGRIPASACAVRVGVGDAADGPAFDLIPAGGTDRASRPLLDGAALEAMWDELSRRYDCVLIDAPAAVGCADASAIAAKADGVVLVACPGRTARASLAAARAQIESAGGRVQGLVLNDRGA